MRTLEFYLLTLQICSEMVTNEFLLAVLYAATSSNESLLTSAIAQLLLSVDESTKPQVLWQLQYQQNYDASKFSFAEPGSIALSASSEDLAFDENILNDVKTAWQKITEDQPEDFLVFKDRNLEDDDGDE
jgi:hypothetical protein